MFQKVILIKILFSVTDNLCYISTMIIISDFSYFHFFANCFSIGFSHKLWTYILWQKMPLHTWFQSEKKMIKYSFCFCHSCILTFSMATCMLNTDSRSNIIQVFITNLPNSLLFLDPASEMHSKECKQASASTSIMGGGGAVTKG